MAKINPKLLKNIFNQDVIDALPSNDKIKHGVAMAEASQDNNSKWKKSIEKRYQDLENKKSLQLGIDNREQDIVFQQKRLDGIKRRTEDENWQNKNTEKNKRQWQDPEYRHTMLNLPKTYRKPIITPLGAFKSRKEAAIAHGVDNSRISLLVKIKPIEYYYITHEEYIILTGIDPTI